MATTRFSTLLVLPATLWLVASLVRADEDCIITRTGGVKEPGVTNNKGECCNSSGHRIGSTWPRTQSVTSLPGTAPQPFFSPLTAANWLLFSPSSLLSGFRLPWSLDEQLTHSRR